MSGNGAGRSERATFASLRIRNYRLYWSGMALSQLGNWLGLTAVAWMVVDELGGGGTAMGFVAAAQFLPTLLFGTVGGVLADRSDLRRLLLITQSCLMVSGVLVAVLAVTDLIELWMVFPLVGLRGLAVAFDNPARQAFVSELVGPDRVPNAVALSTVGFNSARIIGPAVAGLMIGLFGTGSCLVLNAVSYVAALAGLLAIDRAELHPRQVAERAKGQVRQGFRYAWNEPVLRTALLTMAVVGTVSMNFTVLIPLLAHTTFEAGAGSFGLLSTAMGAGSLIGSLRAARNPDPSLSMIGRAGIALGCALLATAASPVLPVAMVAVAVAGICTMTFLATTNAVLQLNSPGDIRGRVLSLYLVLFIGTSPFGSPIVGWIAETFGTRMSFVYAAAGALAGGVLALRRQHLHPLTTESDPGAEPASGPGSPSEENLQPKGALR